VKINKKLIEVNLPLVEINTASALEKSIRHGHPSTLHLWWARRPLAAARAVIFAQMVDDPSSLPELYPTEESQKKKREELHKIIEDLVKWENTTNVDVLKKAHEEIRASWQRTCALNASHPRAKELFDPNVLPGFHDPFAGGGALPLEAQRLGLKSHATDLNPVAVLINKAMIEIPPKFAGRPPVNPPANVKRALASPNWRGAQGLADDVRYYGQWMRDEAQKRIGHLYPKVLVTAAMAHDRPDLKPYVGQQLTVIAWIWARTVKSPNPAFANVEVPLASTFMLSTKKGKEAYVEPVIERDGYRFRVNVGMPIDAERTRSGTKLSRGANFECLMSGTPMASEHIHQEANAGRMGARLMAIVAEGTRGRVYLAPTPEHEAVSQEAKPTWKPDVAMPANPRWFSPPMYGLTTFGDLFTPRQLVALTTFSDLVGEAMQLIHHDALQAGLADDPTPLRDGGTGATAYAEAVGVYLALAMSKQADLGNSLCRWEPIAQCPRQLFGRQAIPMIWDFAEGNPLGHNSGGWAVFIDGIVKAFTKAFEYVSPTALGFVGQADAHTQTVSLGKVVSTDPPYYDNIGYADLSDFFYVWLRQSLRGVFPELFATLAVPKAEELVATPYRHGGKEQAETFFLKGMTAAMQRLVQQAHPAFPITIYYAFKQSETETADGTSSTGWETFLDAVIRAGFCVSGTWPLRTENSSRMIGQGTNALASSIVLVCSKRESITRPATRREFIAALKSELPVALRHLQQGNIAPVDLAQAAIGPGMAVYTRFSKVLDAEGKPVAVREALALINQVLDETLAEQEGDFDADSRFAIAWFDQNGFAEGDFGVADVLARAKVTSVAGLADAGILESRRGKVRLLKAAELPADWDPTADERLTHWEIVHHLIRALESGGESAAATLAAKLEGKAEVARELAYRLYATCERRKRAAEALQYNALVQSFPEITRLARGGGAPQERQANMAWNSEEE
jgi:putative DNA methylase